MLFCSQCGAKCPPGAFCNQCGAKIVTPQELAQPAAAPRDPMGVPEIMVCPYCHEKAGQLLDKIVGDQHYHLNCFNCSQCRAYLSGKFFRDPRTAGLLLCETCKSNVMATLSTEGRGYTPKRPSMSSAPNSCVRCGKAVYESEKFRVCDQLFHHQCFTCTDCGKKLDPRLFSTAHENPYCKECVVAHK
eukprot:m51a1_g12794 hypothetical protein (188) ;mRNA; f:1035-2032